MDEFEARIARLERLVEATRDRIDRLDDQLEIEGAWIDDVLMPAILLLAGFGHRDRIRETLRLLELRLEQMEATPLQRARAADRVRQLDELPRFPGIAGPPDDLDEPDRKP